MRVYVYERNGGLSHTLLNVNTITETGEEFIIKGEYKKSRYAERISKRFYSVKVFTFKGL